MWRRDTFKNCGDELEQLSKQFQELYLTREPTRQIEEELIEVSVKGRDLLDILALTIRRELDDRNIKLDKIVGFLKKKSSEKEQLEFVENFQQEKSTEGFKKLSLREACNKIAHTKVFKAHFYVGNDVHYQTLCGTNSGDDWIAVIDIFAFAKTVQALPTEFERAITFGTFQK